MTMFNIHYISRNLKRMTIVVVAYSAKTAAMEFNTVNGLFSILTIEPR